LHLFVVVLPVSVNDHSASTFLWLVLKLESTNIQRSQVKQGTTDDPWNMHDNSLEVVKRVKGCYGRSRVIMFTRFVVIDLNRCPV
jgi:hypothetical protein